MRKSSWFGSKKIDPSKFQELGRVDSPQDTYIFHEVIGKGAFGYVYRGVDKRTSEEVAIKIVDMEQNDDDVKDILGEIAILQQCGCDFVTRYFGSYLVKSELWIVMEYLSGGSVKSLMKPRPLEDKYISIILRGTLQGLDYLHKQGNIHRDVKADNLLVAGDGRVKLADFSISAERRSLVKKKIFCHWYSLLDGP